MAIFQLIRPSVIRIGYRQTLRFIRYDFANLRLEYELKTFRQYSQQSSISQEQKLNEIINSSNFGSIPRINEQSSEEKVLKSNKITEKSDKDNSTIINVKNQKDSVNETNPSSTTLEYDNDNSNDVKRTNELFQKFVANLPSHKEKIRSDFSKKTTEYMDLIQQALFRATQTLNDVTGYSSIEKLKQDVDQLEEQLKKEKEYVKQCKLNYSEAIKNRSVSQKEINELLTRKHNWSPDDLERFTELYRNDHSNELKEQETAKVLEEAENLVEALQLALTQLILSRYHEEQIWSDKIRRSSTWGTWILMGINMFLFLLATFIVEPWKRRRLVDSFELKIKEYLQESGSGAPLLQIINPELTNQHTTPSSQVNEEEKTTSSEISDESINEPLLKAALISFNLLDRSWEGLKALLTLNYKTLLSNDYDYLTIPKQDITIIMSVISISACAIGSLLTLYFR